MVLGCMTIGKDTAIFITFFVPLKKVASVRYSTIIPNFILAGYLAQLKILPWYF